MNVFISASVLAGCLLSLGCGSDDDQTDPLEDLGADNEAQTPPTSASAMRVWLETGAYEEWQCETEPHAARSPSPHGVNRICSNDAISRNASGSSDWPKGAAAVKEMYSSTDETRLLGHSVYVKTQAQSAAGSFYWYEASLGSSGGGGGAVIEGFGDVAPAMAACVACHSAAGEDVAHTPSPGARDYVYSPIP